MKNFLLSILLLLLFSSCQESATSELPVTPNASSIHLLPIKASKSNIHFNNQIIETAQLNVFIWNFLYTGAGVAVGDLNNDNLPDIYFAGNDVDDKIYINKGNFTFQDITENSGINAKGWSTGVTMADVNADGNLDIYVCRNSPTTLPSNNRNQLFINKGNGKFAELAEHYGIADIGFSIQSTFFDIDNDGDLDMYLVNQPMDNYAKLINNPSDVKAYPVTDKIYINYKGKFVDRTSSFKANNQRFGLNASIGDFNLDGWTDLYVCNDYSQADHLYINRSGKLRDELADRVGHTSMFAMGSDVADINQDGWLDIYALDMAFQSHYRSKTNMESMDRDKFWETVNSGHHFQYAQNSLQVNSGDAIFKEAAQLSGLAKTDWSAAPLFLDLDANGTQDILITNGILRDLKNNDLRAYLLEKYQGKIGISNLADAMSKMPSNPVSNLLYKNKGDLNFEDISDAAGFNLSGFSHGMAYADFNQDGKMDVVVNNMNAAASIYKNVGKIENYINLSLEGYGKNKEALGATILSYSNGERQSFTMQRTRGFLSSSDALIHIGLGSAAKADSIIIIWNHREMSILKDIAANQQIHLKYDELKKQLVKLERKADFRIRALGALDFVHKEKEYNDFADQALLPYKLSQLGPFLSTGDINGDGLQDIYAGGAAGQEGAMLVQNSKGKFERITQAAFSKSAEEQKSTLIDLNGDQDLDLIISSGSNEEKASKGIKAYLNTGTGNFQADSNFPKTKLNSACHLIFDVDKDGDKDLFIAGRMITGKYPYPSDAELWINDNGNWKKSSIPMLQSLGMVSDALTDDVDNDGDEDIVVVGEWMKPTILINDGKGNFSKKELNTAGVGLWWSIEKLDADNDGDEDLLLGNLGWNNKFGGREAKLEIYGDDFDGDGDNDVLLTLNKDGKQWPLRGRECSSEELPFLLEKFPSYAAFGKAEITDLINKEQLEGSKHYKINTFSNVLLLNQGNGNYTSRDLPLECQFGAIKDFSVGDFNDDGNADFFYAGNHFSAEVETARYDAQGLGLCLGDGQGNFTSAKLQFTQPKRFGDLRSVKSWIDKAGNFQLFTSENNGSIKRYKLEPLN